MRVGLRALRQVVGGFIMLVVALSAVGYVVYAANGILNEVQARDTRAKYDQFIGQTAPALSARLTAEVDRSAAVGGLTPS